MRERVLHEAFVRARRRNKCPLVSLYEQMMMNAAAPGTVRRSDHVLLWEWTSRVPWNSRNDPRIFLGGFDS